MDASTGLNGDQYEDPEWHAAVQLVGLSILVVAADSPISAAASEVSTKNGVQVISSQHGKMEANSMSEEVKTDSDGSDKEKKEFKKPDTILPCARCNSMKTKFCYFNNYNVNQPRHYCHDCKRYWTEGGSLRDVPIGSARRKNKQPLNRHHATKPRDANGDVPGTSRRRSRVVKTLVLSGPAKENEAIATSGSEVVPCKSLCLGHNIEEQKHNTTDLVSLGTGDNKEEKSSLSSAMASGSLDSSVQEKEAKNISGHDNAVNDPPPHTKSYPAEGALVFPYISGSNSTAITASTQLSANGIHGLVNSEVSRLVSLAPAIMPAQGIQAPGVPFPQVPLFWPGTVPPNNVAGSRSDSLTLGKHPREANLQEEEKAEKTFWVPKALSHRPGGGCKEYNLGFSRYQG